MAKTKLPRDFLDFAADFAQESDRAAVILGASHLEILLYQLLQSFFLPSTTSIDELLDSDRALGTFSAKIAAAYRLGLVDAAMCKALHLIRKVRNTFAHEAGATSLSLGSSRDRVRELITPFSGIMLFDDLVGVFVKHNPRLNESSAQFRAVVACIGHRLHQNLGGTLQVDPKLAITLFSEEWKSTKREGRS